MLTCFYETRSVLQILLLVVSQFTVISLAAGVILLFKRSSNRSKQISLCVLIALNIVVYILMQLNNRITGAKQEFHLHIPFILLLLLTVLSLIFSIWAVLSETRKRKTINHTSIKEAFDNLPTGVCFFNDAGLPVLCNLAMNRFCFAVCGKNVQFVTDLENCLADHYVPITDARRDGSVFVLPDDSAWNLKKRSFTHENGELYMQYIALDVTDLYKKREEVMQENEQLKKVQADLKNLSANMLAVTREEEILNTKMHVHDEMGRCLMAAQKYLSKDNADDIPESLVISWQRAVSMLKYNNDTSDEDMLYQIRKTCEFLKISFVQTGKLPEEEGVAYLLTCAVRECVTNAVRYAGADKLYADFSEEETAATVMVTNSGIPPEREIIEGGGLSTLRRRVERVGGTMTVQSLPNFKLTVTVPKRREGIM